MLGSTFCNLCASADIAILKSVLRKLIGLQLLSDNLSPFLYMSLIKPFLCSDDNYPLSYPSFSESTTRYLMFDQKAI